MKDWRPRLLALYCAVLVRNILNSRFPNKSWQKERWCLLKLNGEAKIVMLSSKSKISISPTETVTGHVDRFRRISRIQTPSRPSIKQTFSVFFFNFFINMVFYHFLTLKQNIGRSAWKSVQDRGQRLAYSPYTLLCYSPYVNNQLPDRDWSENLE